MLAETYVCGGRSSYSEDSIRLHHVRTRYNGHNDVKLTA